jgi:dTDP-4-dehydrorhamnose reductase
MMPSSLPPAASRRALVTGAGGMLGTDLVAVLTAAGWQVTALDRAALDILDAAACEAAVAGHDVVLNAAAYTRVDDAESDEAQAFAVNAEGAQNLARASAAASAVLVQYSTDYVFAGDGDGPYAEDAPLAPVSAYGRSKADGERRAQAAHPDGTIVLRTAWLYGEHGPNFVRTMMRLYRERGTLTVVDDQRGQPTWTLDLATHTARMLAAGVRRGVLHGTSSGATTWHGFARAIVENLGGDPATVIPTDSARFVRPARRPANSVLAHDGWRRLGLAPIRPWREALDDAMSRGIFT